MNHRVCVRARLCTYLYMFVYAGMVCVCVLTVWLISAGVSLFLKVCVLFTGKEKDSDTRELYRQEWSYKQITMWVCACVYALICACLCMQAWRVCVCVYYHSVTNFSWCFTVPQSVCVRACVYLSFIAAWLISAGVSLFLKSVSYNWSLYVCISNKTRSKTLHANIAGTFTHLGGRGKSTHIYALTIHIYVRARTHTDTHAGASSAQGTEQEDKHTNDRGTKVNAESTSGFLWAPASLYQPLHSPSCMYKPHVQNSPLGSNAELSSGIHVVHLAFLAIQVTLS